MFSLSARGKTARNSSVQYMYYIYEYCTEELRAVLPRADNENIKQMLYTVVQSLAMRQ
jgi:hypothetical protein